MSPLAAFLLWSLLAPVVEPLAPALALSRVAWAPFWIPSGSMKPTLRVGDYVVVRTLGHEPRRGDVVVYRHPVTGVPFVQRLIGLPGDRVRMVGGRLHLNDEAVEVAPAGTFSEVYAPQGSMGALPACRIADGSPAMGEPCRADRLVETLPGGRSYEVLDLGPTPQDDTAAFVVPEGHLFVLGDNRDNSTDSRFAQGAGGVGFVPRENVIGRAATVIVSSAGPTLLDPLRWRADRLVRRVR